MARYNLCLYRKGCNKENNYEECIRCYKSDFMKYDSDYQMYCIEILSNKDVKVGREILKYEESLI